MSIAVRCCHCGKRITFLDSSAGEAVPCPTPACRRQILVPSPFGRTPRVSLYTPPLRLVEQPTPPAMTPAPTRSRWKTRKVLNALRLVCLAAAVVKKWGTLG
jgi:hypothetical protein